MPTRKISLEDGVYYHIYNRWYNKNILFHDTQDYERFYKTIIRYNKAFTWVKIDSYCFLSNHFHFVIHSDSGLEISHFLRKIQQAYAMYYRAKYKDSNPEYYNLYWPLFEWRFQARHIDTEKYLAQCVAYVNYNPLKHHIVDNIDEYKWTSYHQILSKQKIVKYKDLMLSELEY